MWLPKGLDYPTFTFFPKTGPKIDKDKRSNSCGSTERGSTGALPGPSTPGSASSSRRPSRAFLIKQRDSGEETLVTLTPMMAGSRINGSNLPTILGSKFLKGSLTSIESHTNDLRASPEALEAQRVEKLVRHLRRQATAGSCGDDEAW